MTTLVTLPVLLPLGVAILQLALHRRGLGLARNLGLASTAGLVALSWMLLHATASGGPHTVAMGSWPAPFGIILVADRLAATMVAVTAAVALPALLAATAGTDREGLHFHPFFQIQLAGLNGAFLTGDLFNLFVFFEVLLIASYALLAHGKGPRRARAGLHYVVLNLLASLLFLFALGLLYGMLGTLNLADIARRLPTLRPEDEAPARAAFAILLAVLAFKAALLPLGFWLPRTYGAATAPVAALFAILTKVGIYAILRLSATAFEGAGWNAFLLAPWLLPLSIATVALATLGVLAARRLGEMVAWLLLVSTGMLGTAVAEGSGAMLSAMLFYLPHTTLLSAALFLLVGLVAAERGEAEDRIEHGPRMRHRALLGTAWLVLGVAVAGLPPLSGFLGKLMLLSAAPATPAGVAIWVSFILSGFAAALAMARAGSTLFWERGEALPAGDAPRAGAAGLALALVAVPALVLGAAPLAGHARATAEQALARAPYVAAVFPGGDAVLRERRP
jgi:multicomponent K+:H+ antiporter subunit D